VAQRLVSEDMTREVVSLRKTDALRLAVELEISRHIRHFPVVDEHGTLVGILTDRDIKRVLPTPVSHPSAEDYEEVLDGTEVGHVMTREPYTVASSTLVAEAVRTMVSQKIGGFPVVDDGRLVGMFTQSDALRGYLTLLEQV
jgi:acetoin utilization protein AcuB